ncbi:MAG: YgiT-type zinc finger protein [Oscillospiraceae bacterium]|nr:YgiT-type zinc finger protein [Oscillospiraceae bacterium]
MKCMKCGRDVYQSRNTEAVELENGCLLVIRNIPCQKCRECDEILYTGDVVQQLEQIIAAAARLPQEVMVVNYDRAA